MASGSQEDGDLEFEQLADGTRSLKAGKLTAVLHHVCFYCSDILSVRGYLFSFRMFDTPISILSKILDVLKANRSKPFLTDTELNNVGQFLHEWMNVCFDYDFSATMVKKFTSVLAYVPPQWANRTKLLLVKKRKRKEKLRSMTLMCRLKAPPQSEETMVDATDADVLATALTLIEWDLFVQVRPDEFLAYVGGEGLRECEQCGGNEAACGCGGARTRSDAGGSLAALKERFNSVSYWVATQVVSANTVTHSADRIKKFIQVAAKLLKLRNFNGLMEVMAGLNNIALQRLKFAWEIVDKPAKRKFAELEEVMSHRNNFRSYRDMLSTGQPCIPFLSPHFRDFVFVHDGNPTYLPNGHLNFAKVRLLGTLLHAIQCAQLKRPPLEQVDPALLSRLTTLKYLNEEELDKLSTLKEPRVKMDNLVDYSSKAPSPRPSFDDDPSSSSSAMLTLTFVEGQACADLLSDDDADATGGEVSKTQKIRHSRYAGKRQEILANKKNFSTREDKLTIVDIESRDMSTWTAAEVEVWVSCRAKMEKKESLCLPPSTKGSDLLLWDDRMMEIVGLRTKDKKRRLRKAVQGLVQAMELEVPTIQTMLKSDPEQWTPTQVCQWLSYAGMPNLLEIFFQSSISGVELVQFHDPKFSKLLENLIPSQADRFELISKVQLLKHTEEEPSKVQLLKNTEQKPESRLRAPSCTTRPKSGSFLLERSSGIEEKLSSSKEFCGTGVHDQAMAGAEPAKWKPQKSADHGWRTAVPASPALGDTSSSVASSTPTHAPRPPPQQERGHTLQDVKFGRYPLNRQISCILGTRAPSQAVSPCESRDSTPPRRVSTTVQSLSPSPSKNHRRKSVDRHCVSRLSSKNFLEDLKNLELASAMNESVKAERQGSCERGFVEADEISAQLPSRSLSSTTLSALSSKVKPIRPLPPQRPPRPDADRHSSPLPSSARSASPFISHCTGSSPMTPGRLRSPTPPNNSGGRDVLASTEPHPQPIHASRSLSSGNMGIVRQISNKPLPGAASPSRALPAVPAVRKKPVRPSSPKPTDVTG
eukprot:CAMPEP_0177634480 /NCGR_PEP_ID=MMETSP0447-20121125/3390_1 /TAXON_ID=0 /ORGANISM="Stygamoeba regulata, Strain BSH-02190019" /LENGTH=1043 /DNA_ID=CAMNT_0019136203 /DNA_START=27 /DNA_END=3159 /DNA_ORIENTATION=+